MKVVSTAVVARLQRRGSGRCASEPINEANLNKLGHIRRCAVEEAGGGRGRRARGVSMRAPINYFLCPDLRSPPSLNVAINQVFSRVG